MIKNKNNIPGYCEEYDGEALRELCEMAKMYVARENGVKAPKSGVPDGSFSDFDCGVWSMMTELIRYGIWLGKKSRELTDAEFMAHQYQERLDDLKKMNERPDAWKQPILGD